jgi:FKBP-type peptidyl-prolyl cis-trans isomerase
MAFGSIGFYFLYIIQGGQQQSSVTDITASEEEGKVDPTAYKVTGDVTELQITDLKVGTGAEVKPGDTITFHYKGTIAQTGVKFDSSYDRGEPIEYPLASLIEGWQQGIPGMKVGGKRRLVIPSELGYGDQASSGIPANSDLVFEIEVLATKPTDSTE